jgi:hypothetical protein
MHVQYTEMPRAYVILCDGLHYKGKISTNGDIFTELERSAMALLSKPYNYCTLTPVALPKNQCQKKLHFYCIFLPNFVYISLQQKFVAPIGSGYATLMNKMSSVLLT